eukprot:CAMPEP_0198724416 /NCGR_PEP_ID=MMETSP1475-20131203/1900_1 /TAXON_ID= ORGANISM="Unidentified sp., Strain CCMP1999" /NCGR_SAMPLE_ID=MMETSP1475 /ASSEMBLY_ACC=CAM_ASM_001111 /LENGTH=35 /DNA_ID= /DNA_START= /DNA_END= /DNA_ORIENTATION=
MRNYNSTFEHRIHCNSSSSNSSSSNSSSSNSSSSP